MKKHLSIITINYNNAIGLESTFKSLAEYNINKNFELIVIDGGSNDGSLEILKKYMSFIDILVSEPDFGIFDAMNKGVKLASGQWLFFLNSGDELLELNLLKFDFSKYLKYDVIYGDVLHIRNNKDYRLICDINKGKINHQAIFYKKQLHYQYGYYNTDKNFKISDYFFFKQIPIDLFIKIDLIFSKAQPGGYSERVNILNYRNDVDFFLNKISLYHYLLNRIIFSFWWLVRKYFR